MAVPLAGTLSATAGRRRLRARRVALAVLVFVTVAAVALRLAAMLWENGTTAIELAILALSTVLLVPIALSFWMAVFGFLVELRGVDPLAIDLARIPVRGPALARRTAIVMPVYDEEPARMLAGLRTSYESLEATGRLADFDFFVLSDTLDPQRWLDEEVAFTALRAELSGPSSSSTATARTTWTGRPATSPTSASAGAARTSA
jgi:membrane glycosyltransferase